MILANSTILASECDTANAVICAPANVSDLFEFQRWFSIGPFTFTRTSFLMLLAAVIVIAIFYFGLRRRRVVPTKFSVAIEEGVAFIRDGVARDIIGPEGTKYVPYLVALFFFLLVANLFEVTPLVNFPITSRMAIPFFLSLITYVIFMTLGFAKNGYRYFTDIIWPKHVPVGLRWLVGIIELVSTYLLRPFTLAVRLFANMMAGHLMLTLLLASGVVFIAAVGDIGARALIGLPWLAFGLFIYVFEIVVAVLQAYIFTLLSAVYIESSINFEH